MRWISLPRVSGGEAKRPDHLFQIMISKDASHILTIESKETSATVERNIGKRLIKYILELMKVAPNVFRTKEDISWRTFTGEYLAPVVNVFSVAAFRLTSIDELLLVQKMSGTDAVMGVEFLREGTVCLHLLLRSGVEWLGTFLKNRTTHFNGWLKVEIN